MLSAFPTPPIPDGGAWFRQAIDKVSIPVVERKSQLWVDCVILVLADCHAGLRIDRRPLDG